jgi:hypothetical protein
LAGPSEPAPDPALDPVEQAGQLVVAVVATAEAEQVEQEEQPDPRLWTDESEEKAAADAAKRIKRLAQAQEKLRIKSWDNWMEEAAEYNRIALSAERLTGSNGRMGRVYSDMMNYLLRKNGLTDVHTSQMRSALIQIAENRSAVEAMRNSWDANELSKWASPLTVWDKFRAKDKANDPRKAAKAQGKAPKVGKSMQEVLDDMQAEINRQAAHIKQLQALLRQPFDGLDSAEIADLVIEQTNDDQRRGVIERLGNWDIASGTPAGLGSRLQADDGWPIEALPEAPVEQDDEDAEGA